MLRILRLGAFGLALLLAPFGAHADTLIRLDTPNDFSRLAVRSMKAELGRVVSNTSLALRWQDATTQTGKVDGRLFNVVLIGECVADYPEPAGDGPLGWTSIVDGRVLPYIAIDCSRIRSVLAPEWARLDSNAQREVYLGKAMARVLAHELVHAFTRTRHHADDGLTQKALTPRELVSGNYRLSQDDFVAQPVVRVASAVRPKSEIRAERPMPARPAAARAVPPMALLGR